MLSEDCELVTLVDVIKGRLEVTTLNIYFFDCSSNREEGMCFCSQWSCLLNQLDLLLFYGLKLKKLGTTYY